MIEPRRHWRLHRSDQAGVFAAIGGVSMTFQRTLMPRNTMDQAVVTGATMASMYLTASILHDAIENVAAWALEGTSKREVGEDKIRRLSLAGDIATIIGGVALQRAIKRQDGEPLRRAAARTAAWWLSAASLAGLASGIIEEAVDTFDERTNHKLGIDRIPVALLGGAIFATIRDFQRRQKEALDDTTEAVPAVRVRGARAIGLGAGIGAGLVAFSLGNRALSRAFARVLGNVLPGGERLWRPFAHLTNLAVLDAALYAIWSRVCHRIEAGTGKIEPAFDSPPGSPLVSGGAMSQVGWASLGREGRRHVGTVLSANTIQAVMGEPALEPIRIYIGLDSAPTDEDRVQLAMAELERTGAFDRGLLLVTSPTGTGYVNYVAVESVEYLTRGNCATVTIQYSRRPSPMSLDRIWEGRKQFRMLLAAIHRRLYRTLPESRPRLVLFGESLGAHTSQDAFLNAGTQGLEDAGVERALWVGTPHLSKWRTQVQGKERPDVDHSVVGEFANFQDLEALPASARRAVRYYLATHNNDGVARFGPDLLIQEPDWLGDPASRPVGVPPSEKWVTPTTFFQTLIDMNNSMNVVPGEFVSNGHDYRADIPRFVREAYDLSCSKSQMERIEEALRRYELLRHEMAESHAAIPARTEAQPRPKLSVGD